MKQFILDLSFSAVEVFSCKCNKAENIFGINVFFGIYVEEVRKKVGTLVNLDMEGTLVRNCKHFTDCLH